MSVFVRHPVDNPSISQRFGVMNGREFQGHVGVDYRPRVAGVPGDPIYAPADGFVVWASGGTFAANNPWEQLPNNGNNGKSVILQHPAPNQAVQSMYCHLSRIAVQPGQFVRAGQVIGYMGWTGYCIPASPAGTHLHWEVFIDYGNGQYPPGTFYGRVNPLDYFTTATVVPLGTGGEGSTATPSQKEEDMTPELTAALADIAQRVSITNNNVQSGTKAVRADLATVHNTIIKDVGSQLGNIQKGVNQNVDVDSLALELAGKLEQRDLKALAEKLTVTVKEK